MSPSVRSAPAPLLGLLIVGVLGMGGCPSAPPPAPALTVNHDMATGREARSAAATDKPGPPAPVGDGALVLSEHDGLGSAREALEAALRLPVDLPLPFPRVEHRGDRYRVTLARGPRPMLLALQKRLEGAGLQSTRLVGAQEAQSDEVVRLGIICAEPGATVPLFRDPGKAGGRPGAAVPKEEIARLPHGRVLLLADAEDAPEEGGGLVERGFLYAQGPQVGLVRSTDVLLPPDCTPRDEDNDDGNGRLLAGGRLCLTTRFAGKEGSLARAALLAVKPSYRRCTRFADAGTFDGFDHNSAGTQIAVEAAAAPMGGLPGVVVYDVTEVGELKPRLQLAGLSRPAYLGRAAGGLAAVLEEPKGQSLVLVEAAQLSAGAAAPVPRRLFTLAGAPFQARSPTFRPAAPALRKDRLAVTFQQACEPAEEQRVRAAARKQFRQCVREVEVDVDLSGGGAAQRRCVLNNAPTGLDESLATGCPG